MNAEMPTLPPPRHVSYQPGLPPGSRPWLVLEQHTLLGDGDLLVAADCATRAEADAFLQAPVAFLVRHPRLGWHGPGPALFNPAPASAARYTEAMACDLAQSLDPGGQPLQVFALLGTGRLQPWPLPAAAPALRLTAA